MSGSTLLNTRTIEYQELIGNGKRYRVPPYQRDYSWSQEQWEDLWDDILELRSNGNDVHYMGALVVQEKTNREFWIIDGQQRLVTLSLLILAVIDLLNSMGDEEIESEKNRERSLTLRNRFIGEKDLDSFVESSRFRLNSTDDEFYQDYLVQLDNPLNLRKFPKSNRLLMDCFRYFRKKLKESSKLHKNGGSIVSLITETVSHHLSFILITVDDELDAYTVFETLNARGLELTTTDLLKNYLFSRVSGSDLEFLQRRWRVLVETVGQARFPEFLRYHLLCRYPKIRRRRIFKLIRSDVSTNDDVYALIKELDGRAEVFAAILDWNNQIWLDIPDAKPYVRELNLFQIKQPMPVLFAAWEHFNEADFVRVLKLICAVSFRYSVVSQLNNNALEPIYHRAAWAIMEGEARTPAAVFERIRPVYVLDQKMQQDFSRLELDTQGSHKKRAKYVLARLEADLSGRACDPDTDPGTIEHILPENPAKIWEEIYPLGRWEDDVYRLGNLTLLEAKANRTIGNNSYTDKLEAYAKSEYKLTGRIPEIAPEEWTPALVDKRQEWLAERAVKLWRSDFA